MSEYIDLLEKYRPRTFDEVIGQDRIVERLRSFLKRPKSCGKIFHGGTGTGKSTLILCLAAELGINIEDDLGGYSRIPAGDLTADNVRARFELLHLRPLSGNGWKLVQIDEADKMAYDRTKTVETLIDDKLEHLPPQTIMAFSTNYPKKLPARFLTRCQEFKVEERPAYLRKHAPELIRRIWVGETGGIDGMPDLVELGDCTDPDTGTFSFRAVAQRLKEPLDDWLDGRRKAVVIPFGRPQAAQTRPIAWELEVPDPVNEFWTEEYIGSLDLKTLADRLARLDETYVHYGEKTSVIEEEVEMIRARMKELSPRSPGRRRRGQA